jgi:hypothetical protein
MRKKDESVGVMLISFVIAIAIQAVWWLWLYPTILRALGWF